MEKAGVFAKEIKKVADINKDTSLLPYGTNYSCKKLHDTGPWIQFHKKLCS